MKVESLVIVKQHVTVNLCPNLVHTARHAMGIGLLKIGYNLIIIIIFILKFIISYFNKFINYFYLFWISLLRLD